jgi:hypothetical protein
VPPKLQASSAHACFVFTNFNWFATSPHTTKCKTLQTTMNWLARQASNAPQTCRQLLMGYALENISPSLAQPSRRPGGRIASHRFFFHYNR